MAIYRILKDIRSPEEVEKINARCRERINCEICAKEYSRRNKVCHEKTKFHIKHIQK